MELAPGYTLDSDEIEFKGISPTEWEVELPQPRISRVDIASDEEPEVLDLPQVELSDSLPGLETAQVPGQTADTIEDSPHIRATKNGFFVAIDGNRSMKIDSERNGDRIDFFLEGITLPPDLVASSLGINQYGVSEIEFEQVDDSEAVISLNVSKDSPDWLATYSRIKGLLLVPKGKLPTSTTIAASPDSPASESMGATTPSDLPEQDEPNLIDEIELVGDDDRLLVHADNELAAVARSQQQRYLSNNY